MQFTSILPIATLLLAIPATRACLWVNGEVSGGNLGYASSTDNGEVTCNSAWGWRIDQDDHFSLTCVSGFIYAFTRDGTQAWYRNGPNAYAFTQQPSDEGTWTEGLFGC